MRNYTPLCEYCHFTNCDRMQFTDNLELRTKILLESKDMANNEKRKQLYRSHTYEKHGFLGKGVRKKVDKCIIAFAAERFPPPPGTPLMGHRDS